MHILLLSSVDIRALHVGGGVAITFDLLEKKLVQKGHKVTYLSSWNGGFKGFHTYFYKEYRNIKPCIQNFIRLIDGIKEADVVVSHDNLFCQIAAIECYLRGKPYIYGHHTDVMTALKANIQGGFIHCFLDKFESFSFCLMSLFKANTYVVSHDFKLKLKQRYGIDATIIDQTFKDGVFRNSELDKSKLTNLRETILQENTKYILLFAGRISKEKRLNFLIKAVPAWCTLVIIGDGPERDNVNSWRRENIVFINQMLPQCELLYYYHIADLFVSASNFETYGMSCHEALLCSTPVIVEDAQGFRSQIDHGRNGYLVKYENTSEAVKFIERELKTKSLSPYVKNTSSKENILDFITNSQIGYQLNVGLVIIGYFLKYILFFAWYFFSVSFENSKSTF